MRQTSISEPGAVPNNGGSNNGLGKIDYHLNDRNSLNGEYFIGIRKIEPGILPHQYRRGILVDTLKFTRSQLGRAVWIWTPSSTLLNEMRFGIDREYQTGSPAECTQNLGQPNYATAYDFVIQPVPAPLCGFPAVVYQRVYCLWSRDSLRPAEARLKSLTPHSLELTPFPIRAANTSLSSALRSITPSLLDQPN